MVYKFFDKKTGSGAHVNQMQGQELNIPVIKKFNIRKVYARLNNNIWAADLAEIESFSFNHDVKFLLCVIDVFTKYAWVKPLKDKKAKTVLHGFTEIVNESKSKPNYGLIKKENFIITIYKNGLTIMIFQCTPIIITVSQ